MIFSCFITPRYKQYAVKSEFLTGTTVRKILTIFSHAMQLGPLTYRVDIIQVTVAGA